MAQTQGTELSLDKITFSGSQENAAAFVSFVKDKICVGVK